MRKIWKYNLPVNEVHAWHVSRSLPLPPIMSCMQKKLNTNGNTNKSENSITKTNTYMYIENTKTNTNANANTHKNTNIWYGPPPSSSPRYNEMQAEPLQFQTTIISADIRKIAKISKAQNFSSIFRSFWNTTKTQPVENEPFPYWKHTAEDFCNSRLP